MSYLLNIKRNFDNLIENLKLLAELIEKDLNNDTIIGVQLFLDDLNIVTISVIVDMEAEIQNRFNVRSLLSKSFNDFAY